jgi:hypothetical protein
VERALGVLERREVRPQLGLLKSTMLQLDSTFNEKAYGASSFTDFVEKLQKADYVEVTGGEGRYMIRMKGGVAPEKPGAKPEEAIPLLRDVLEAPHGDGQRRRRRRTGRVRPSGPSQFRLRQYGFQEFGELLNYAQDKGLVRIQADEEKGLTVYLGAEFHPPAAPPEPEPVAEVEEEEDEPQPLVPGQPTATGEIPLPELPPKPQRRPRAPRKIDPEALLAEIDGPGSGRRGRHPPPGHQQSRARAVSAAPHDGAHVGRAPRPGLHRHHFARHRTVLRR